MRRAGLLLFAVWLGLPIAASSLELSLTVDAATDLEAVLDVATATAEPLTLTGSVRVDIQGGSDLINGLTVSQIRFLPSSRLFAADVAWTLSDALSDVTADLEDAEVAFSSTTLVTPATGLGTSALPEDGVDIEIDDGLFTANGDALEVVVGVVRPFDIEEALLGHGQGEIEVGQSSGIVPIEVRLPLAERIPISSNSCVPWIRIDGTLVLRGRIPDSDFDGINDLADNCRLVPNPDQADANSSEDDDSSLKGIQHYGDACDADLDNDGLVRSNDFFGFFRPCLGPVTTRACAPADFDGDGLVSPTDFFSVLRPAFGETPGPGVGSP
ncbi:MAG: thrombospondin type 3 repeat-containing protein [Myxococcota bacterium]|nr:thrombospondin type 3 repeat-containing protein [Myxococcota bacterium]